MLGKLMKYELRATSRTMGPLLILTLALGLFVRWTTQAVNRFHTDFFEIVNALLIFAFVVALIGTAVFSVVLMVMRFQKNLMTDEGYLMFTLPVSVHQLLWAKLFTSLIWFLAVIATDALSLFALVYENGMFEEFFRMLGEVAVKLDSYYTINGTLFVLEALAMVLAAMISACLMFYAPISIGHSFANRKVLLSVVFYFVIQTVLQTLSVIAMTFLQNFESPVLTAMAAENTMHATVILAHIVLLGLLAASLLVAASLYFLTAHMLKKRLNLQ